VGHTARVTAADPHCPCGWAEPYSECCGRYHGGQVWAETAERLMRSRFSAFAVGDAAYLLRTWHPSTRPAVLRLDPHQQWTGLTIVATGGGGWLDQEGSVEFRAHYRLHGRPGHMDENSTFVREAGRWFYLTAGPRRRPSS
jgi:SEC-C motif-containing protein